jgi:hypothetical protein
MPTPLDTPTFFLYLKRDYLYATCPRLFVLPYMFYRIWDPCVIGYHEVGAIPEALWQGEVGFFSWGCYL